MRIRMNAFTVGACAILVAFLDPLRAQLPPAKVKQLLPWQGFVFAATDSGLYQSQDTGRTWSPSIPERTGQPISDLTSGGGAIYAMVGNTPYRGTETGSWTSLCRGDSDSVACPGADSVSFRMRLLALDSVLYLIRKSGNYQSDDRGGTWRRFVTDSYWDWPRQPFFRMRGGLYYYEDLGFPHDNIVRFSGSGIDTGKIELLPQYVSPSSQYAKVNVISDSLVAVHYRQDNSRAFDTTSVFFSMVSRDGGRNWSRTSFGWSHNQGLAQADSEIYFIDAAGSLRRGWPELSAALLPKPPVAQSGFTALAFASGKLLAAYGAGKILILERPDWHHDRIEHALNIIGETYGKAQLKTPSIQG